VTYATNSANQDAGVLINSQAGTGVITFSSASNNYQGGTTIQSGTLNIASDVLGASTGSLILAGGTLEASGTFTLGASRAVSTTSSTSAISVDSGKTFTIGNVISGSGALNQTGSGTLALSGINTYSGTTTVTSGTVAITGSGSLASSAIYDNAAFDISGVTTGTTINGLYGTGTVNLGSKTLTVQGATQASAYSGVMSGAGGGLTYAGTGILTLSGANTYSGLTTATSGTIALTGSGSLADSAVDNNAAFDISGVTTSTTINGLYGTGTVNLGGKALTVQGATQASAYSGVMSGAGGALTYAGTGILTLSGANTYSGLTTTTSGTIALTGSGSLVSSAVANNAAFDISGVTTSTTINGLYGTGTVNLGGKTLTVQGATQASAYSGVMSGAGGGLTYAGTGILTLSGANTYSGLTTTTSGTIALTGSGSLANSAVDNNAAFDISGVTTSTTINGLYGTGTVNLDSKTLTVQGATQASAYSGVMSGTGGALTYAGTGTLTLSGANTYTGLTTISSGTLALSGSGVVSSSSAVNDNGTFDISTITAPSTTINGLYGTGATNLGGKTLIVQGATQPSAYLGVMSGTGGALTYSGTGILTLDGLNTYTGATTVSSGTLQIGDATHTGANAYITSSTGNISVASGATLSVYGQTFNGATNTASNAGTIQFLGGAGSGASTNFTTNTGLFDISSATAGVSIAGIGSASGTGAVHLGANTLSIGANTSAISSIISGSGGGISYAGGTNTLTLSGANTYSGITTATSGTIILTGSLSSSSSITNNAIFDMSGASDVSITNLNGTSGTANLNLGNNTLTVSGNGSYQGILSGAGNLTYSGTSTLTFGGTNTFTGTTTVSSGTVVLTGNVASTSNITNNAIFDMSGSAGDVTIGNLNGTNSSALFKLGSHNLIITGDDTYNGTISGTGGLTYSGMGTLVLNGVNSFSGTTNVVSNGVLVVGQDASYSSAKLQGGANVDASATLQGYGNINGDITNSGTVTSYYGTLNGIITNNNLFELSGETTSQLINNGNAYYYNTANSTIITNNNYLEFNGATAATAIVSNTDTMHFNSGATAGSSSITNTGSVTFNDTSSAGSATINHNGGTLYFNDTSTANGATIASNGGTIDVSGITASSVTVGRLYGDTSILLGSNELRVGALNTNDTISGTINGSFLPGFAMGSGSFVKIGTGTLTLNTVNAYSGTTTVEQGTLILGGDAGHSNASLAGSAVIDAGAVFEGFGTIDGSLTNSGTLQPGNNTSSGTLTVLQNYTQTAQGTYNVVIDSNGTNLLNVTGNAIIDGTLDITSNNGTVQLGVAVPFIQASGGISGQFSPVIEPRFLNLFIQYNGNNVSYILTHDLTALLSVAQTPNQLSVANYIVNSEGNTAINSSLAMMSEDSDYQTFLDQLSGATYANQQLAIVNAGEQFENELLSRLNRDIWCFVDQNRYQAKPICDQKNIWFAIYSEKNQLLNTVDVSGLNTHAYGGALGSEVTVQNNGVAGIAVSYTQMHEKTTGPEDAHTVGGLYQAAVYGRYDYRNWRIGAEVDYGSTSNISAIRKIANINTGTVETTADYQTALFGSQIVTSYDISFWGLSFRPTAGFIYQHINGLDFSEDSDTTLELHVSADNYHSARSQLGLGFDTGFFTMVHPVFYIAWEHEFANTNVDFNANIIGLADTFYIEGTQIGRNSVYIDAGISLLQYAGLDITVGYQGRFAKEFNHNAIVFAAGF
jgi:autotransporter-associated beta strand protein